MSEQVSELSLWTGRILHEEKGQLITFRCPPDLLEQLKRYPNRSLVIKTALKEFFEHHRE